MNWQSAKLTTLSHLEFHKKVIELLVGNVKKIMTQKEKKTKLNRCRRLSVWQTVPSSGT
jgi:hypothetical protein